MPGRLLVLSSTRSGKTRTYIPLFCANSSTSPTTSLLACRRLEKTCRARTKNLSKSTILLHCICSIYEQILNLSQKDNLVLQSTYHKNILTKQTQSTAAFKHQYPRVIVSFSGLLASVKTTDLWFEHVWKNFSKLQVRILKYNINALFTLKTSGISQGQLNWPLCIFCSFYKRCSSSNTIWKSGMYCCCVHLCCYMQRHYS